MHVHPPGLALLGFQSSVAMPSDWRAVQSVLGDLKTLSCAIAARGTREERVHVAMVV